MIACGLHDTSNHWLDQCGTIMSEIWINIQLFCSRNVFEKIQNCDHSVSTVCRTMYSGQRQRNHCSSASLAFCIGNPPLSDGFQARHKRGCNIESISMSLPWRHNGHDDQPHHCLLNGLFGRRSKKTSKLRVTGLCAGNSPVPVEFTAQMASNAEKVSIWWCHHVMTYSRFI